MNQIGNEHITVINQYYLVVFVKLYIITCYQSSCIREYLFFSTLLLLE